MPDGPIDEDLGVTIGSTKPGVAVYMYKNEPGLFRVRSGALVSEKLAREAGFPV